MTQEERPHVCALVSKWLQAPKHADTRPGTPEFGRLIAAAVYQVRYGKPMNRNQRLAYRMHKRRRARLALEQQYGNPSAPNPKGSKA